MNRTDGSRRVVVIGGGLAGLQAAIACADDGAAVTLLEARPRLGGATWSTQHRGLQVDNGQHVFMRCCTAYRAFLDRIGATDLTRLQPRLAVPVVVPGGPLGWIRRGAWPAPAHLVGSLLRFPGLPRAARLRTVRVASRLLALDPGDPALDDSSMAEWLLARGESRLAVDTLWDLLIRPTVNLPPAEASMALAVKVLRTGFLDRADAADLGVPLVPLGELHAGPASEVLRKAGAEVRLRAPVEAIELVKGRVAGVRLADGRIAAEAVIVATPHEAAAELLPDGSGVDRAALHRLGRSPIVNLHVHLDRSVLDRPFVATVGSELQWVFDRTAPSGAERGQVLAVSLSSADAYLGESSESLRARFLPELERLFPAVRGARVLDWFTTREPAATFRQRPGTAALRPRAATRIPGLAVAGAWTATGWPATMEGAVRSGHAAAAAVLGSLHAESAAPAPSGRTGRAA